MPPTRRFRRPLLGRTKASGRIAHGGIVGAKTVGESFPRTPGPPLAAIAEIAPVVPRQALKRLVHERRAQHVDP
jgi:hypothetical protein